MKLFEKIARKRGFITEEELAATLEPTQRALEHAVASKARLEAVNKSLREEVAVVRSQLPKPKPSARQCELEANRKLYALRQREI